MQIKGNYCWKQKVISYIDNKKVWWEFIKVIFKRKKFTGYPKDIELPNWLKIKGDDASLKKKKR